MNKRLRWLLILSSLATVWWGTFNLQPESGRPELVPRAVASYQFQPVGGAIITGSNPAILGATLAAAEGVNTGDWRGAMANDDVHFAITSTVSGYNAYVDVGLVELHNANRLFIQTEFDLDATVPTTTVQICDWVSTTGVHHAADAECTGGGWRNLNLNDTAISATGPATYSWEVYNGYWNSTATTSINTPLSNFVNTASSTVRIRFYSTTNTGSVVNIDFVRAAAVINPVYSPSSATQISGGTIVGDYTLTTIGGVGQTGFDDARFRVPGTAAATSSFYLSFTDVRTYSGANTILFRAEYSCSAIGISHRPRIYNFKTASWEELTTSAIACSASDVASAWAKNNVTLAHYLSGGEIRIGWTGTATGTQEIRLDAAYIMIGTTNTDGVGEISFGTLSAGDATSTRNLDMTGTTQSWNIAAADESNTQAFAAYSFDSDQDATREEASAANLNFSVTPPTAAQVTGLFFASRHMSGVAGTVQIGLRDYGGLTNTQGGWSAVGTAGAASLLYTDNINTATAASGGSIGWATNPDDYVSFTDNLMNVRLRTASAGASTSNSVAQWDFAMVSLQWVEDDTHPSFDTSYAATGGAIVTGSTPAILGATLATTEGVNTGDWRGAMANDDVHFAITSTVSGYNAYVDIEDVQLHNANSLHIQTEFDLDATVPTTSVQICDWVSSTGVTSVADSQCTGGGWRNLNLNDTAISSASPVAYSWRIYNGYWNSTATTSINTPLSNFVNTASGTVRIRFYSTTNTGSVVNIDYVRIMPAIHPVYAPSSATQLTGGTIVGDYSQAVIGGAGQTGFDDARFRVPGTAAATSSFYLSFTDVRTYSGANTILFRAEYSCSAIGISHRPRIYNFKTASWEELTTSAIACSASDVASAWAKNNVTLAHYLSGGEIRIGWTGTATGTQEIRLDAAYIMIGTTNTDGVGEISFGTYSAGDATSTRNLDMTGSTNSWNIAAADESNTQAFAAYSFDSDQDATREEASAANMDFSLAVPTSTSLTGLFFASRHMSGTGGSVQFGLADYSAYTNAQGGWSAVGAAGSASLVYTDNITVASVASGGALGWFTNIEDYFDDAHSLLNGRLRTSSAGASTSNSVAQWDFAMVSPQWSDAPITSYLSFALSDNVVGFGQLTAVETRYASADGVGNTSDDLFAHTFSARTNATGGYVVSVSGSEPTCTACPASITAVGAVATTTIVGVEQFGLQATVVSGSGSVEAPYHTPGLWAYATSSFPDVVATGGGDGFESIFGLKYMTNISTLTEGGSYSAVVGYTVTATY